MTQYQWALCKSLQKQLFRKIYRHSPYVLYNIKYLFVIYHLGSYSLSIIRGGSRTAATSKMERFVIIVNGWKPLTIITKHSTLDVAAVLDPPLIIVTHSMSSAFYVLVLRNITFPNLLFYQILLFRLYLRKYVNNLVIHPQKICLQNLKLIFLAILRTFDLECHGQISVKVELVMFGLIFMNFRKLRNLYRENKKLDLHKT